MAPWGACARYGGASAAAFHRTSLLDALSQKCDWEPWTGVLYHSFDLPLIGGVQRAINSLTPQQAMAILGVLAP